MFLIMSRPGCPYDPTVSFPKLRPNECCWLADFVYWSRITIIINTVFTERPGQLTNDFFQALTSRDYEWKPKDWDDTVFDINERKTGITKYTATRCDLVFGSNAQLRNLAEVPAADDAQERFVKDFIAAWDKVMMLDRYDVKDE
ncbi:MAG: hypothetical protein WBG71_11665 [Leeuwenhoekiella sp.]